MSIELLSLYLTHLTACNEYFYEKYSLIELYGFGDHDINGDNDGEDNYHKKEKEIILMTEVMI